MQVGHLSDLHLGRHMPGDELGSGRMNSLRGAMRELADEAPDAILVAGDVFDGPQVALGVVQAAARVFDRARKPSGEPLPVVVISGNHDPADATALWRTFADSLAPESGVRLVLEPTVLLLCDGNLVVEVYPCQTRYSPEAPWAERLELPRGTGGAKRIVLAHGTLQGGPVPEGENDAYPFTMAEAEALAVDYVALGHFHGVYPPWGDGDEITRSLCYCGTHEPAQFGCDAGWAVLATLAEDKPTRLRRIHVGKSEWRMVEVASPADLEKLRALRDDLENDQAPDRFVIRVRFGSRIRLAPEETGQVEELLASLRALGAQVERQGEFQTLLRVESLDLDSLPAGAVREAMLSLREQWEHVADEEQREILAAALQLGWEQFQS